MRFVSPRRIPQSGSSFNSIIRLGTDLIENCRKSSPFLAQITYDFCYVDNFRERDLGRIQVGNAPVWKLKMIDPAGPDVERYGGQVSQKKKRLLHNQFWLNPPMACSRRYTGGEGGIFACNCVDLGSHFCQLPGRETGPHPSGGYQLRTVKSGVLQRMILCLNSKSLLVSFQRRSFRNRPGKEITFPLEP